MNTRFISLCFVLALASLVLAESVSFKVNYILVDERNYPNGEVPGTLYYRYDTAAPQKAAVRYDHSVYVGGERHIVSELENFTVGKLFKICDNTCETFGNARTAQQWWFKSGDSKGEKEGDYTHYTRTVTDYGVTDLWLKDEEAPGNTFNVKKIYFSTGRELHFVEGTYSKINFNDQKFNPNAGNVECSTETCRTFMDLVFVLDSSGSVGSTNWNTMVKFVKDVTSRLDISSQAAAVAVTAFAGRTYSSGSSNCKGNYISKIYDSSATGKWYASGSCTTMAKTYKVKKNNVFVQNCAYTGSGNSRKYYPKSAEALCKGVINNEAGYQSSNGYSKSELSGTYINCGDELFEQPSSYARCGTDYKVRSSSTSFTSAIYVPLNYGAMSDILTEIQNKVVYTGGDTCQALGLQRAIEVFESDKRGEGLGMEPQRVVIAMTDGDDHCGNMTKTYAKILREQYKANLIEVSITLKKNYDKQLLENISTSIGGIPSYFDIDDFDGLQKLMDKMVTTVCRTDYSAVGGSCDTRCHGFCGCGGTCYCPNCTTKYNNACHTYGCLVQEGMTAGCIDAPKTCEDTHACTIDTCDNSTGCVYTPKVCDEGLKTCQNSECRDDFGGECSEVKNVHTLCTNPPGPCYRAICDPDNADSDSVTGCRYEYKCVGKLPVVYDENKTYVSGCYEYHCDTTTDECVPVDVCKEMSDADKCTDYVCKEDVGKCVPSHAKVVCPEVNTCRPDSKCNPKTGNCDVIEITPATCVKKFKQFAKENHVGEFEWFGTDADVDAYYNCGEARCVLDYDSSSIPSFNSNEYCVFDKDESDTCGVCSGLITGQPTFDSCTKDAEEEHAQHKDTCYVYKCVSETDVTSKCNQTVIQCPHKPCQIVECNQETLQCHYSNPDYYDDLEKNITRCNKLVCNEATDKWELVDISVSKCVGDNEENVPVCEVYDRCDDTAGCVYRPKCVKQHSCTTNVCDNETNTCVEEPVQCEDSGNICYEYQCMNATDSCEIVMKEVEDACRDVVVDACHTLSCSVAKNECVLTAIPYPNETDKCHNYTCHPEDGSWTVVEKCDDGDICTVDSCAIYDGTCSNFKRDCLEINMTGYGSCFGRSCSKARKNGCFRKVYENSYFDECGNCVRSYSAGDSGLTDSETSDCKKALSFQEEAAVISAGIMAAIIIACVIGAVAVSTAGTLATKELIKRARAANNSGAHDNPLFEDDGAEMENPTFVGNE